MLLVKIGKQGGRVGEFVMQDGATIEDLFRQSKMTVPAGGSWTVNGLQIGGMFGPKSNTKLTNKDIILITDREVRKVDIRIAKLGQILETYSIPSNSSIIQALSMNNINMGPGEEVWVHFDGVDKGYRGDIHQPVSEGMILIVERKRDPIKENIINVMRKHTGQQTFSDAFINEIISVAKRTY